MINLATIRNTRRGAISHVAGQAKQIFSQGLRLLPLTILLATLATTVLPAPKAHAATFDVNGTGDAGDAIPGDGICDSDESIPGLQCTLRAAIEEANALTGPAGPYNLTAGELTVSSEIILNGNGETISAGGLSRIFLVDAGGNLSLNGVTIRDGNADAGGGILINWGGTLNVLNSTILSNTAATNGGGVNSFFGMLNIANSTISGNHADDGGGIIHFSFGAAVANLTNVTITNNHADTRGGGVSAYGLINLKSTIVAGNSTGDSGPDCDDDPFSPFITTAQYNFIGDNTGCAGTFPSGTPNANHDFAGTRDSPLDPLLGSLTGNPAYHPLLAGSLAIDQIPVESCTFISNVGNPLFTDGAPVTTDQSGTTRPQEAACDIGASEATSAVYADLEITKSDSPDPVIVDTDLTYTIQVTNHGPSDATGVTLTDILPTGVTFVSVMPDAPTCTLAGGTVTCDLGDLVNGADTIVTVVVTPTVTGIITNTASVTGNEPDPITNNTAVETTTVESATAIELISFSAQAAAEHITLRWETAAELDNEGFNLWRSKAADGEYTKLNPSLIPTRGNPDTGDSYEYTDTAVVKGMTYFYKLEDVDLHGLSTFHGPVSDTLSPIQRIWLPCILN